MRRLKAVEIVFFHFLLLPLLAVIRIWGCNGTQYFLVLVFFDCFLANVGLGHPISITYSHVQLVGGQYGFQCCRHLIQQHARTGQRRQNTTRNCVGAVKDRNLHKHTHFCRDTVFSALTAHQPTFYVRNLTEPQTKKGQKMSKYEMTFKH